jgi:glutaredoxin
MEWNVEFDEVNINEDVQGMAMMRLNNHRTVPQLYWNKAHVGPTNNDTMSFTKQMLEEALDLDNYQGGVESFR